MHCNTTIFATVSFFLTISTSAANDQLFENLDQNQDGLLETEEIDEEHRRLFDRLLRTSDQDQDGRLSSDEFQTSLEPKTDPKPLVKKQGSQMPGADAMLLLLARMDTNTNGQLEQREVPGGLLEMFQRIEERVGGERDGVLDRRELTQAAPRLSRIAQQFARRMNLDVELELALLSDKQWNNVQSMLSRRRSAGMLADPARAREFFRQYDANGDGQLNLAEVPDQLAQRFNQLLERADRNGDEQISEKELMTVSRMNSAMAAIRPTAAQIAEGTRRLLRKFDRDGDHRLSPDEAPRQAVRRFNRLDADGDGNLDRDELRRVVELLSRVRRPAARATNDSEKMMQEK